MHRFFVPEENRTENEIVIHGDDVNHIRNVLRMAKGEKIMVSCGKGVDYECEILAVSDSEISLLIRDEKPAVSELPVEITLFQALPKKDKMELVIQKAVELGAASIVPVKTKRCVVKLDAKKEEKKVTRWRTIAESAAKQSGRGVLPEVTAVKSFSGLKPYWAITIKAMNEAPPSSRQALMICTHVVAVMPPKST